MERHFIKQVLFLGVFVITLKAPAFSQGFNWAQSFVATTACGATGMRIDANNNLFVMVGISGTNGVVDADASVNVYNITSVGANMFFLLKEDASGNFLWAKEFQCKSAANYGITGTNSLEFDANGNIYIAYNFRDTVDFDPGLGTFYMNTKPNTSSMFIVKLNPSGDFVWARQIDSASMFHMKVTSSGLYISGACSVAIDADPGSGVYNLPPGGVTIKLDTAGNFVWGHSGNLGAAFVTDSLNNLYAAMPFGGTVDFDPSAGVVNLTASGISDIAILKLDSSGNFQWVKQIGAGYDDVAWGIAIDGWGNPSVTGYFEGTVDFDPGLGVSNLSAANRSPFTVRLGSNGNFRWAKKIDGNSSQDVGRAITANTSGNIYTTGLFSSPTDFDPGPGVYILNQTGAFIQKLDSSGNFVWARSFASSTPSWIEIDHQNSIYTTGVFGGSFIDFDPGAGTYLLSGSNAGFIQKLCASPNLTLIADTNTVCSNSPAHLTTTTIQGATYYWLRNDSLVATTNTGQYNAGVSGIYSVEVYGSGCPYLSNKVTINVYPSIHASIGIFTPANALVGQTVNLSASVYTAGAAYMIDWFRNGQLFSTTTSTNTSYIKQAGVDTILAVVRIPTNPCAIPDTALPHYIASPNSINDALPTSHITVFPNPFTESIALDGLMTGDKINFYDALGQLVQTAVSNRNNILINTANLIPGYYLLRIYNLHGTQKANLGLMKR